MTFHRTGELASAVIGQDAIENASPSWLCPRCKKRERECIDGETQWYCIDCNDRDAERYREQQEWNYYHPSTKDPSP